MNSYCENQEDNHREEFLEILNQKNIQTVFQPIVSLRDGGVYGYEALSRGPKYSALHTPDILFKCAQQYNKLWELEFLCRLKAFEASFEMGMEFKIFLNVNPNIMEDIKFRKGFTKEYLNEFSIDPKRIIFEITENEAINNISDFIKTVDNYKEQDYRIAIDDAGAGYSGLNLISDIHPNFIKLDMKLIRDIDSDVTKQSLIKCLNEFASFTETALIAEGIETREELQILIELGIQYGQGFFLQRPNAVIKPISKDVIEIIKEENANKRKLLDNSVFDVKIDSICKLVKTIGPNILVSQVDELFKKDETISGFCVVHKDIPIGVITRNALYKKISGQYGYILYSNKPVKNIMDKNFMRADYQTTIDVVGKDAMQREFDKIYDFVVISRKDKFYGIVTVKDLMEKLIEIEFVYAKHLNPLSELPGNLMIEQALERSINTKDKKTILYFDLDNFKAYNDLYGFENGDKVLKDFAQILKSKIPDDDFIGHIGGDDFVAIVSKKKTEQLCTTIIAAFNENVVRFYNKEDALRGYITSKNRNDIEENFPLLSVSIAGVASDQNKTIFDLAETAAKIKKKCKKKQGSNFLLA
ncbi:EAL domain-containing protein [Acetobacterium paludosum]|uniref:EAL domain-containing protein n=1 Tax=Acetobacterium paludosum TaxID=52693 RepID=A0A923KWW9_9FIRM|nr:GGDEF domain-containing protein [Acetobacterium paludosum]MBC3888558.1 EAL domain-containing protein [Acetobacterium paludosum]